MIGSGKDGDNKEAILRNACTIMIGRKSLQAPRPTILGNQSGLILASLLSDKILVEWQLETNTQPDRYVLAFAHHVLFDYAVARLLLRDDTVRLIDEFFLIPGVILFAQPSFIQHFHYLWHVERDHKQFWGLVFLLVQHRGVSETAKSIGPTVATELTVQFGDLKTLLDALSGAHSLISETAEEVYNHLTGALLENPERLLGPSLDVWSTMLAQATKPVRPKIAYAIRALLLTLYEKALVLTPSQKAFVNEAARNLLEFAWSQSTYDRQLVVIPLRALCRTFEGNPIATTALIEQCLELPHLEKYGFAELPWLAREIEYLMPHAPKLITKIYASAFGFEDTSNEPSPLEGSWIMARSVRS